MSPLPALVVPLVVGVTSVLVVAFVRSQRDRLAPPGQGVMTGADGVSVVPILAAESRGGLLGARIHNSANPKLSLDPAGLTFKVLKQDRWAYDELIGVDVAKTLFGPALEFRTARAKATFTVRDQAVARQVLSALPRAVPLTPRAATLRDTGSI